MQRTLSGVLVLSLATIAMTAAVAAPLLTEYVSEAAVAGTPSEIGHHARWDDSCEALEAPRITIERAPSHGNVCINKGDVNLVISRSRAGLKCIGKSIPGVHVIYNARSGFTGTDTMRYGLDVPEGHVSLEVSIVIQAGRASSSPIATSAAGETQPSGPMPECPSLAS
jgi:hypothetical protein